jgi:acetolactate synthase I/III small subunit
MKKTTTILVFAQNKRGVLERIAMLIRKKMYNLEQITASDTEREGIKRLTISFTHGGEIKSEQIVNQINKIIEVVEVKDVSEADVIQTEVCLIKIKRPKNISDITRLADVFRVSIVHVDEKSLIIQGVGTSKQNSALAEALKDFGILEMGSSGYTVMEK